MAPTVDQIVSAADHARYARLGIRLRAALIDSLLSLAALVATIALARAAGQASNAVFAAGAILIILYDPVLVSWRGCTIGHQICNLRVVDDGRQSNPTFLKALFRFAIKIVLGWLSFLTIAASSRLRAIHDLAVGTTVQVYDSTRVKAVDFSAVRTAPADLVMPSAIRRLIGIGLYGGLSYILLSLVTIALTLIGLISFECLDSAQCSQRENLAIGAAGLGWIASLFAIVSMGWWGRLPGFRAKRIVSADCPAAHES